MQQNHFGKSDACNINTLEDIVVNKCDRSFWTTLYINVKEISFQRLPIISICVSNVIPKLEVLGIFRYWNRVMDDGNLIYVCDTTQEPDTGALCKMLKLNFEGNMIFRKLWYLSQICCGSGMPLVWNKDKVPCYATFRWWYKLKMTENCVIELELSVKISWETCHSISMLTVS